MKKYLAVSILASNNPTLFDEITFLINKNESSIRDCRVTHMGSELAMHMLLAGNWSSIAKLETQLAQLANKYSAQLITKRADLSQENAETLPYIIQIFALDNPGIIYRLNQFFLQQKIAIKTLACETYTSPDSSAITLNSIIKVSVPGNIQIAEMRECFNVLCDELNLDAILEPDK